MYSYVDSVVLSRSTGSQWEHLDISNYVVFDIYNKFSKVYLILSNPVLSGNIYVDFDTLKLEFSGYAGTLIQLLADIADRTLTTVPSLPTTTIKHAKYSDAFRSEYKVDITVIGQAVPDNYPDLDKHDLVITRPKYKTDMRLIHDYCLVSVNGFFHMTDTDGTKAYVHEGADTMRKGRANQMGILSFLDIGKLTKVKLDKANIYPQDPTSTLKEKIYFDITQNVTDKAVILVLGGYLVFPEPNVFWQRGDKSFALNLNNLPYVERLYESNRAMDLDGLDGLEIETATSDPDILDFTKVWSDDTIKNYLTLSQSFLVIIDTKHLITQKHHLRHSNLPGMFTSYTDPVYPLIVNYGKMVEYWKTLEDGHWSVTVEDSFYKDYIISQQPTDTVVYNNFKVPNGNLTHSRGFLLDIMGYNT